MSSIRHAHWEAAANSVAGVVLAQLVLWVFGLPFDEAVWLNFVMIIVSYVRAVLLRLIFSRWLA